MHILQGEGCVAKQAEKTEENTLCLIPFSSKRKRASIVMRNPSQAGTSSEVRVYCKGAPDVLFPSCSQASVEGGELVEFSGDVRALYDGTVKKFAA